MLTDAGVIFFLQKTGSIDLNILPTRVVAHVFAVLSAFYLITYFLQGAEHWGWLFPATILGGIALTMGLMKRPARTKEALLREPVKDATCVSLILKFAIKNTIPQHS